MSVWYALLAGICASRIALVLLRSVLEAPVFRRENYRGHELATAGGLVMAAGVLGAEAVRSAAGALGVGSSAVVTPRRALFLLGALGFTLLGLADDLGAVGAARGFRGHLRSLREGRLSTGGLKLLGGGALALVLAGPAGRLGVADGAIRTGWPSLGWLLVDGLVIALSANLANLLDRAPGRVVKVGAMSFAAVAIAAACTGDVGVVSGAALVVGSAIGILPDDLGERLMVGDTGANAIGAAVGLAVVVSVVPMARVAVLVVLVVLNLTSERVSFSRVIDRVPPLRLLDRLGATPERRSH